MTEQTEPHDSALLYGQAYRYSPAYSPDTFYCPSSATQWSVSANVNEVEFMAKVERQNNKAGNLLQEVWGLWSVSIPRGKVRKENLMGLMHESQDLNLIQSGVLNFSSKPRICASLSQWAAVG